MAKLNERIKERRIATGMTLLDVAQKLGVTEATMQRYESGDIKNIKNETVVALAEIFGCTPTYLMGWDTMKKDWGVSVVKETESIYKLDYKKTIPILGRIAAGLPLLAVENIEGYERVENPKIDFALRVKGDSMIGARIFDGDLVYVIKDSWAENGDIVIALINGDDATVKRFYDYGVEIILRPENPTIPEQRYKPEEVQILGKVVEVKFKV